MSRPFILASMPNNAKVLIRMGAEGGGVDVYRLIFGRWQRDAIEAEAMTQVRFDATTNSVTLTTPWSGVGGIKMDPRDAKRLLAAHPPPWLEREEAWDEGDEANHRDTDAADLRAQRAEERELKAE